MNSTVAPWKYHVFLSFRGEDTRNNFTGYLHAALKQRGIITFIDDDELRKGEDISQELFQAIQDSLISIVILSPNYASSRWCLLELQKILESKGSLRREVVPVFFNVDPSHVRRQKGTIGDSIESHRERFADKVQGWRDALHEVANLSGYDSNGRNEAKLIEEIVADVWAKLQPKLRNCFHNELVGIESRVEEVNSLLKIGLCDVRFIGIWGMTGIGKTTLARIIYERTCCQFDTSCFLANVNESSEAEGLVALQRKLLSKLRIKGMEVDDKYEGKNIIGNLLCNKKVLLVLDYVSEIDQLENFCIKKDWLGPGSRVIATTKNMHVLTEHGEFEIYKAELLNNDESLQLFCKKAFKRDEPIEGYSELCEGIIRHAQGLPLTLEVWGSYFCGRSELEWKESLEKMKKFPPHSILKRLRISYDALSDTEKKIFLDVACFFKGKIKDQVTQIFEICGDLYPTLGIRELVEKCLLTEYYDNHDSCYLGMHDLLQTMGRNIVLEESPKEAGRRSRLWSLEDIDHVMSKNKGTDLVEGIHIRSPVPYEANWDPEAFSMMRSLKILIILCDVHLPRGLTLLPSSLKILEWKACPLKSFPSCSHLDELVLLRMRRSKIIQLWERTEMSKKLKFMDLSYSEDFIRTPDFSMLPNLEQLILEGCVKLVEVHPSLGQHKKLVVLDLKDCKNLKALPSRMEMDSLEKLFLSGCLKVKKLPEFGKNMTNLLVLDAKNCKSLVCLPSFTCNLKSLKVLNILGCTRFSSLPQNIDENECLEELDLSGPAVREIPSPIASLPNLKKLYCDGCSGPSSTSNSLIRNLLSPVRRAFGFGIHKAPTRLILPSFISRLASLKELVMRSCNLRSIPNDLGCLPSLEVLDLYGNDFSNLSDGSRVLPPSFSNLTSLKSLNMANCNLHDGSVPENLSCLSSLQILNLGLNEFTCLPAGCVANLSHLSDLHVGYCPKLKYLPDLPPNLREITTICCPSMQPLSFSDFLSYIITATNDLSKSFKLWWMQQSDIPSWFHNQNCQFLHEVDDFPEHFDHYLPNLIGRSVPYDSVVSIKVDISHLWGSSVSWGICLCIVVQERDLPLPDEDMFHRRFRLTYKDLSEKRELGWIFQEGNHPNNMNMFYFPSTKFPVDCGQIEFIFYTKKFKLKDMEENWEGQSKLTISKCGWYVISEEDVEEWRRSKNECNTRGNTYGKRSCVVEELGEEDNIVTNEESETSSGKRRKIK